MCKKSDWMCDKSDWICHKIDWRRRGANALPFIPDCRLHADIHLDRNVDRLPEGSDLIARAADFFRLTPKGLWASAHRICSTENRRRCVADPFCPTTMSQQQKRDKTVIKHVGVLQPSGKRSRPTAQLIVLTVGDIKGLTGNAAFPIRPVDLKTLRTAADELVAAVGAPPGCRLPATAQKNDKRDDRAAAQTRALRSGRMCRQYHAASERRFCIDSALRSTTALETPAVTSPL